MNEHLKKVIRSKEGYLIGKDFVKPQITPAGFTEVKRTVTLQGLEQRFVHRRKKTPH